jgi:hypothetical protein
VTLDGQALSATSLGTALPLDPGPHTVSASAPGKRAWSEDIVVAAGPSSATISIPDLADAATEAARASSASPAPSSMPAATPPDSPAPTTSVSSTRKIAAWASLGGGAIAIGLGTVFGLGAISTEKGVPAECRGNVCSPHGIDLNDQARTSAAVSTVSFGVAIVAVGVGTYLLLTGSSSKTPAAMSYVAPSFGPGGAALSITGRFE